MVSQISRRFFLSATSAFLACSPALANAPTRSLRPRLRGIDPAAIASPNDLIQASGLSGQVACAVADANTGLGLEAVNGTLGLPPASVAKALTALYGLEVLGAEHRFETRVLATGPVKNGIVEGDLILAGGGDPTLDTEALAVMARQLKQAGIRQVRGAFKVYEGALPYVRSIDSEQPEHVGYSPAVSGIALNFNRVHFEWKRASKGYAVSMDARSANYRPDVAIARMKVVNRQLPVYTYEETPRIDHWTVAQTALGKGGGRWLPVRKPALYAGDVFQTLARSHGIVLSRIKVVRAAVQGMTLVRHQSAPLQDILRGMLKYSNNLTAEMVGLSATKARTGAPASLTASAQEMSRWAAEHFGMTGTSLVDHSGLGDASRMTADNLVQALIRVNQDNTLRPLLKPFAMRDTRGRVNKAHSIDVDAKTGTLNFVSGLGGYMTAPDGTVLAFAIFIADSKRRARIPREERERPQGARTWNRKAKKLQQQLIERWGAVYGS